MAAPQGAGPPHMEIAPSAEGCSDCNVAALILYQDEICPASYCSLHVHCAGDGSGLLGEKEKEALEDGPTFHFHRFTFLLMDEQPGPAEEAGSAPGSRAQGVPAAGSGDAMGAAAGACPAWVSPLSTHLHTFECEGVGLMESHLLQLRRRIEAPGGGWKVCARFLHPLLAACYPSLASLHADAPAFALPLQMPLESLVCIPLVHQDLVQVTALTLANGAGPEEQGPAGERSSKRGSESRGGGGGASAAGHTRGSDGGNSGGAQNRVGGGQAGESPAYHGGTGGGPDSLAPGAVGEGGNSNSMGSASAHLGDREGASWAHQGRTAPEGLLGLAFNEAAPAYNLSAAVASSHPEPSPSAAAAAAPPKWGSWVPSPGPSPRNKAVGGEGQKSLVRPSAQSHFAPAILQPHTGCAPGTAAKGPLPQLARMESCGESLAAARSWQPAPARPFQEPQAGAGIGGGGQAFSAWDAAALACLTPLLQSPRGVGPPGSDSAALAVEEMRAVAAMLHSEGLLGELLDSQARDGAPQGGGDPRPPSQHPLVPVAQQPGDRWARAVQEESQSLLALLSGATGVAASDAHPHHHQNPLGRSLVGQPATAGAPAVSGPAGAPRVSAQQQLHEELLAHLQQHQEMQLEQAKAQAPSQAQSQSLAQAQGQAQGQVQPYTGPSNGPGAGGDASQLGWGPVQGQEASLGEGFPFLPFPSSPLARWDFASNNPSPRSNNIPPHSTPSNTTNNNLHTQTHNPSYPKSSQLGAPFGSPFQPHQLQGPSLDAATLSPGAPSASLAAREGSFGLLASQQQQHRQQQQQQQQQQHQQRQQQQPYRLSPAPRVQEQGQTQGQAQGRSASQGFNAYRGPSSPSHSPLPPSLRRSPSAGLAKGTAPALRSLVAATLPPAFTATPPLRSPPPAQGEPRLPYPAGSPGSTASSGSGACISYTDAGPLRAYGAPLEGAAPGARAPKRARFASEEPGAPRAQGSPSPGAPLALGPPPGPAHDGTAAGAMAVALASEMGVSAAWDEGGDTLSVGEDTQCLSSSSLRPGCALGPGAGGGSLDKLEGVGVEQLRMMFDRNINEAAECLGVGLTVLKKHCRALGILRWPHRKIDSLNKLIQVFQGMTDVAEKTEILRKLEEEKERIALDPMASLGDHIKTLRQAYFKANYRRRRAGQGHTAGQPGHERGVEEVSSEDELAGNRGRRVPMLPTHASNNMLSTVS